MIVLEKMAATQFISWKSNASLQITPHRLELSGCAHLSPFHQFQEGLLYAPCQFYIHCSVCNEWIFLEITFTNGKLVSVLLGAMQERDREVSGTLETDEKRNRQLSVRKNEERVVPTAPRCRGKLCNCPINILDLI